MISDSKAKAISKQLKAALPYYGEAEDYTTARLIFVGTLRRNADDEAHADRIAAALLETLRKFPVPADVLEAARSTRMESAPPEYSERDYRQPPKCAACNDTGWTQTQVRGFDCVAKCVCRKQGAA
jgi:hypothetical protein